LKCNFKSAEPSSAGDAGHTAGHSCAGHTAGHSVGHSAHKGSTGVSRSVATSPGNVQHSASDDVPVVQQAAGIVSSLPSSTSTNKSLHEEVISKPFESRFSSSSSAMPLRSHSNFQLPPEMVSEKKNLVEQPVKGCNTNNDVTQIVRQQNQNESCTTAVNLANNIADESDSREVLLSENGILKVIEIARL